MSGMRSTGRLHLGHYVGVLKNWLTLQRQYPCYFMVADWHALTTRFDDTKDLPQFIHDMALDWLAVGLDPAQCTIYVQSQVPEIAELHLLLSMMTPNKWLETDPTLKDMVAMLRKAPTDTGIPATESTAAAASELTHGLLGYPVLQTADILSMGGALVPVGKDQEAHLEISRDIARRFNHVVGQPVFAEPRPLFTEVPLLKGLDGRKMGKSFNNAVFLGDTDDETWAKLKAAVTDPARVRRQDEGDPQACEGIFPLCGIFTSPEAQALTVQECTTAARGCMDCKKLLAEAINDTLRPIRQRRAELAQNPEQVALILAQGKDQARERASATLQIVRQALHLA
jgi:tryptophanyl-tRNA synthetase